jgi:hypothetical protein
MNEAKRDESPVIETLGPDGAHHANREKRLAPGSNPNGLA